MSEEKFSRDKSMIRGSKIFFEKKTRECTQTYSKLIWRERRVHLCTSCAGVGKGSKGSVGF